LADAQRVAAGSESNGEQKSQDRREQGTNGAELHERGISLRRIGSGRLASGSGSVYPPTRWCGKKPLSHFCAKALWFNARNRIPPMIFSRLQKNRHRDSARAVYTAIVAQSRQPEFYSEWGVADTVTGRYDVLSLHVALLLHRLRKQTDAKPFAQALFDIFFQDMDRSLREMGVGDLSVPKRIARMTELFYGLLTSLGPALDSGDELELRQVLARNILDDSEDKAAPLATYCLEAAERLKSRSFEIISSGQVQFGAQDSAH
jgi:cytochrome b pre-mRNA-processing protein 3